MPERLGPAGPSAAALDEREVRADETELELALLEAQLRGRERQLLASRQALLQRSESIDLREKALQQWAVQAGEPGLRLASQLGAGASTVHEADEEGVLPRITALQLGREEVLRSREQWLLQRREDLTRRQAEVTACERAVPRMEMAVALRERRLSQTSARLERLLSDPTAAVTLPELPSSGLRSTATTLPEPTADRAVHPARTTTSSRRLTGMPVFRPAEAPVIAVDAAGRPAISGSAPAQAATETLDLTATPQTRILVDRGSWIDPRHAETWTIPRVNAEPEAKPSLTRRKTTPISSDVWSKLLESSGGPRKRARRSGMGPSTSLGDNPTMGVESPLQQFRLGEIEIPRGRVELDRPTQVLLISVAGERPALADKTVLGWEDSGEWVELPVHVRRTMPEGQQTWVVVAAAEGWSELDLDRLEAALSKA